MAALSIFVKLCSGRKPLGCTRSVYRTNSRSTAYTRDAASSFLEEMYLDTTMLDPSVTQKFNKLGSVTPASSAYLFNDAIVSSMALRRISGEKTRALGSGI
jgi:hypothetical protein